MLLHEVTGDYERDGFAILNAPIIPADIVEHAVAGIDAVLGAQDPSEHPSTAGKGITVVLSKSSDDLVACPGVQQLLDYPALEEWARRLTGATKPRIWWVQYFGKNAGEAEGGTVGLHQDWTYWAHDEASGNPDGGWGGSGLCTCWVALGDVGPDAGPLLFVRGSHRWGVEISELSLSRQDHPAQQQEIEALASQASSGTAAPSWEVVADVLPKGGMSFHDWRTIHGSEPNVSRYPRRGLALHLCTENSIALGGPDNPQSGANHGHWFDFQTQQPRPSL